MSDDVTSSGFFAVLKNKIKNPASINEILEEANATIRINYEGTIIYNEKQFPTYYGLYVGVLNNDLINNFKNECNIQEFEIDENTIRPYICTWYNGSDSDMSDLTLEQYLQIINNS